MGVASRVIIYFINAIDSLGNLIYIFIDYSPLLRIPGDETDEFWTKCNRLPISDILYSIATTLLFNAIDREAKELLP